LIRDQSSQSSSCNTKEIVFPCHFNDSLPHSKNGLAIDAVRTVGNFAVEGIDDSVRHWHPTPSTHLIFSIPNLRGK
jgi:hypothetical protein